MHPQRALDATGSLPDGLVPKLLGGPDCPDERLGAFEAHTDPAAWVGLLGELQAADPGHHRDIQGRRLTEPKDLPALSQQWRHEVQTVQRRCYELAADILSAAGSVTLGWSALPSAAATAVAAVTAVDPELGALMRTVEGEPGPETDVLEFDRQKLKLRDRLPVEWIHSPADTLTMLDGFAVVDPATGDSHIYGLWLETAMLAKQFMHVPVLPQEHTVVLLARAPDGAGGQVARLGRIDPDTSVAQAQQLLGDRPLVAITSHSYLVDGPAAALVDDADPVFVLMDLPIGHQIRHWISQDSPVSWAVAPVDEQREVSVLVIATERASHLVFFSIGGMLAHGALLERLRQTLDPAKFRHDSNTLVEALPGLRLAIQAIMATFHLLDQDGPT
ncbi:MAG: hypothetical protein ABI047_11105 [Jatrophihabitantaceae bacterium]